MQIVKEIELLRRDNERLKSKLSQLEEKHFDVVANMVAFEAEAKFEGEKKIKELASELGFKANRNIAFWVIRH